MVSEHIADGFKIFGETEPDLKFDIIILIDFLKKPLYIVIQEDCIFLHFISVNLEDLELLASLFFSLHKDL